MKYPEEPVTKKSLGQHWLTDEDSLDAMCEAVGIQAEDTVLEIGPGLGPLTKKLVARAKQVVAVEFDEALARDLPGRVPADNLTVIQQDILSFDFTSLPPNYKVVANIPYYLTSNLLREMCTSPNPFARAALLIQKEVAERVCAKPGDMSLLSVAVQLYCEVSLGQVVPAYLFTPPPKVDSQILKLTFRDRPLFPDIDERLFFRLVKAGFGQRRKTLLNSLSAGLHLSKENTATLLGHTAIAPNVRPQELRLEDWHRLYVQWRAQQ